MAASGRRTARSLLITVVVLAVLLVGADRIGLLVAEHIAAENIRSAQHLTSTPDVDVDGFPFLTQLAERSYGRITVTATDVPVGGSATVLTLSQLRIDLHDVDVSRDFASFHAGSADATASVSYAQLGARLGIDVTYAGHGRISATKSFTVAGKTVSASVTTEPRLANGALSFAKSAVNGASSIGAQIASVLTKVFDVDLPLQGIPFEVRVTALSAGPDGLALTLVGSDLTFHKP